MLGAVLALVLGVHVTEDAVHVTTQVVTLHNGHLRAPPNTTHLLVEIGASDLDTLDEQVLPRDAGAFLVTFEPMLDKYSTLLSRGDARFHGAKSQMYYSGGSNRATPLGYFHPRAVVLPLAVSANGGGAVTMHIRAIAGCSSLLDTNAAAIANPACKSLLERRIVDSISMEAALRLLPPGLPIRLLKLDAQGLDAELVRAIPHEHLPRVEQISFEAIRRQCEPMYVGQTPCEDIAASAASLGFNVSSEASLGGRRGERSLPPCTPTRTKSGALPCELDLHFFKGTAPPVDPSWLWHGKLRNGKVGKEHG